MAWQPHRPAAGPGLAAPAASDLGSAAPRGDDPAIMQAVPSPRTPGMPLGPLPGPFGTGGQEQAPAFPPALSPYAAMTNEQAGAGVAPLAHAADWGATALGLDAARVAGLSYLGWWLTGVLIYFGERRNRFVRFHAIQSIIYTGALTVFSVLVYVLSALLRDLFAVTHSPFFQTLSVGIALLGFVTVLALWWIPVVAAWTGHLLRIPLIAPYAERYAAPLPESDGASGRG